MPKHRDDLTRGDPLPSTWVNAFMEFVGTMSANFRVERTNATTVGIPAGTGDDQVAIGIDGRWRFNTATTLVSHPGGAAGTYDLYVTAYENDLTAVDPADATNYGFGGVIRARSGGSPSPSAAAGATALSRRVATVQWDGAAITTVRELVNGVSSTALQDGVVGLAELAASLKPSTGAGAGAEALRALGTAAGQALPGNHASVTNERTPTSHGSTHQPYESDEPPGPLHARVYRSNAQAITTNLTTAIAFDTEIWDEAGPAFDFWDVSQPTRLTAPYRGVYLIGASVNWQANAAGRRTQGIFVNNSFYVAFDTRLPVDVGSGSSVALSTMWLLNPGNYVELKVSQTSGGALNVERNSSFSAEFWIVRLGNII